MGCTKRSPATNCAQEIVSNTCGSRTFLPVRNRTVESADYSTGISGHFDTPFFRLSVMIALEWVNPRLSES